MKNPLKPSRDAREILLIAFLVFALIIGIVTIRSYGESWDELQFFKYADRALNAYILWPRAGTIQLTGNTYDNYGPAYVMLVALITRIIQPILPLSISDTRHLLYFLTYLVGIWAFYKLAQRWLSINAALGSTLLFATQPLFIGHAFISPKDIPFLSFFLLSLLSGLRLFDSLEPISFTDLSPCSKRTLLVLSALWLGSVFGLYLSTDLIHARLESLVRAAASGGTNIISFIASDIHKVKPEIYIQKYFVYFLWARSLFFLLSSFLIVLLYRKIKPSFFSLLAQILPSAILLGFTTSIRVLGPFIALFVAVHALRKIGRQSILPLALYALIAVVVMYITWPYIWLNPIGHFIESVRVMSQYPWRGSVLFNGVEYPSTGLPYSYLLLLLGIQLTEPVWVLFFIGLVVAVIGWKEKRELIALTLVWFAIPLIGFIVTRSPLYDNFRQIFFILPPVFMIAGVAFEKIKNIWWQTAIIILCLLPGLIGIIQLHPYEYIYYNRFIGGVDGAFRKYELDYWGTSYREAASWINDRAPANATVWVEGPAHLLGMYLRDDIKTYSTYEADRADHYDYVVALTRYDLDLTSYPDAKIIHSIDRDGALLTVIKQP